MKRREFLITTTAGLVGASPLIALAGKPTDPFTIDAHGNIRYTGNGEMYTVRELYAFIKDEAFAEMEGDVLTLDKPWQITDEAATKLKEGSVVQNDGKDVYMSLTTIGDARF